MQNSPFPAHDQLIQQAAKAPKGDPNALLQFMFGTPEFLTAYQKDTIRAWMQDPAAGAAEMAAGPSGQPSPAGAAGASGPAKGGQPGASPAPAPAAPPAPAKPTNMPAVPKPI